MCCWEEGRRRKKEGGEEFRMASRATVHHSPAIASKLPAQLGLRFGGQDTR